MKFFWSKKNVAIAVDAIDVTLSIKFKDNHSISIPIKGVDRSKSHKIEENINNLLLKHRFVCINCGENPFVSIILCRDEIKMISIEEIDREAVRRARLAAEDAAEEEMIMTHREDI